jgi:hypothetical protein
MSHLCGTSTLASWKGAESWSGRCWEAFFQEYFVMQCHALEGVLPTGKRRLQIDLPLGK